MSLQDLHLRGLSQKEIRDLKILALFTSVFCRSHHSGKMKSLEELPPELEKLSRYRYCQECLDFLLYATDRRLHCPLPDKPACKNCSIHCYRSGHREKVCEIMRYSGRSLIKRGRLDLLWHYLF